MKNKFNAQLVIPFFTAVIALIFIGIGFTSYGFWDKQPTPGFFPIIIAVILLISSIVCIFQILQAKDGKQVKYTLPELMVILGGGSIIIGTFLIGLIPSCLIYILVWLRLVEKAPWKTIIIIEIIVSAIVIGVFSTWLQVRFPVGLLGEMIM